MEEYSHRSVCALKQQSMVLCLALFFYLSCCLQQCPSPHSCRAVVMHVKRIIINYSKRFININWPGKCKVGWMEYIEWTDTDEGIHGRGRLAGTNSCSFLDILIFGVLRSCTFLTKMLFLCVGSSCTQLKYTVSTYTVSIQCFIIHIVVYKSFIGLNL